MIPTRVLVVGLRWPPEPFIGQLLRALRMSGAHLTVAAPEPPDPGDVDGFARVPTQRGVPLAALAGVARRAPSRLPAVATALARRRVDGRASLTLAAVRAARPDVVYLPWTATGVHLPGIFDLGVPVIVSCRGSQVNVAPWNPERRALKDGLAEVFARAAAVHCVSDAIRDEAAQHGLDPARATVIRPAVDLEQFPSVPTRRADGPLELVIVGTVSWRKGIEDALLALRRLTDDGIDVRCSIVGPEADGGATRHAIGDLGLEEVARLVGQVPWDEIRDHLARADVLVHPSLSEGLPNVVLEAMATGRPVVVTAVGGTAEAVTDGVEGAVVPARDPAALRDAIAGMTDAGRRDGMGRAGRARIEAGFTLDRQVAGFSELIERVTGGRP